MYIKTYYQISDTTCGISSLKTFMYYHSKGKIDLINEDINHSSYSLKELKDIAESYGIFTEGVKFDSSSDLKNNSIVLLENDTRSHYVYFIKRRRNKYIIIDPSVGELEIEKDEFESSFKGVALIFISKNNIVKIKPKYNFKDYLIFGSEIILSIPLILLFTTFFNERYLSFIMLIIYWILFIFKKFLLLFLMDKFDRELEVILLNNNTIKQEYILKLYKYKTLKHSLFSKLYNFFLLHLMFVLFLSNLKYGYVLSLMFILISYFDIFFYTNNKNKLKDINELENINDNSKYVLINKYSSTFVKKYELFKLFSILVFTLIIFIYYLLIDISLSVFLGIVVSSIFIIMQNNIYELKNEFKNYQIGKTIFDSLK